MKLGVVGGRDFNDKKKMWDILNAGVHKIEIIVSGGARGADKLAAEWCQRILGKEPIVFEADWDNLDVTPCVIKTRKDGSRYNAAAGVIRNKKIVEEADKILAFWDGKSPGTKTTIELSKEMKVPCTVVYYHG